MANNLSNYLTVKGTDEVIDALKKKFDAAKEGSENILGFCKSFYDDVETDGGGILYSWLYDNVGTKWIYLE